MHTLDEVAALNAADQRGHRFEMSTEGVLSGIPLPDSEHAAMASRLVAWLLLGDWPADQLLQAVGVRIPGQGGSGGRIPDLSVWARRQPQGNWLAVVDLLLIVEIKSTGSARIDEVVKLREYADAGIPHYWIVDRDAAQTVTLHVLGAEKTYQVAAKVPLASLLRTAPADHHIGG